MFALILKDEGFFTRYLIKYLSIDTVKPLKTDTPRDEQKCPSYRGVRLIEVIFNRNLPLGHR